MKKSLLYGALIATTLASCSSKPTITLPDVVLEDFNKRKAELANTEYLSVLADSAEMSTDKLNCLKFLYAYMPLPDVTDYPGDYFKENVEVALKAREEMPWGKDVPVREFLHFVLPVRVNNENLDGHRKIFYDEVKERVAGMSMEEAILEVNHWCHERATYQPSDSRTHSPLATVSSGIGRCGEESTFTVAALRSIGIPARQVYTPRWAHTDDNHAWVEAWANGKWHFLGACEPEAVLDLGWFNDPATRGMLMSTRTFGKYDGPEEKLLCMPDYTDINVTSNYAPTDTIIVTVRDNRGNTIADATVDFRLYNYAEFYPIASKKTGPDRKASLVAGLGDLLIWASKDTAYDYKKVSVGKDKSIDITIDPATQHIGNLQFEIFPPVPGINKIEVDSALQAQNLQRKAYEDSIRMLYVGTFTDNYRGNRATIDKYLATLSADDRARAEIVLSTLSEKDLSDVSPDVITDAMVVEPDHSPLYTEYVLAPRIESEFLVPFRGRFIEAIGKSRAKEYKANPDKWAKWVLDSITTDKKWMPATVRMSPWSVYNLRMTDIPSRNLFFVASARAMGIPARIDPMDMKPQYYAEGQWKNLLSTTESRNTTQNIKLSPDTGNMLPDLGYYTHFSLSKIENGRPELLNFPEEATLAKDFNRPITLDTGEYMLVTGQRLAGGGVLVDTRIFSVGESESPIIPVTLRHDSQELTVIGNFNSENLYYDKTTGAPKSILSTTGRGYYILAIVSEGDEPSNHVVRDIAVKTAELNEISLPMLLLYTQPEQATVSPLGLTLPVRTTVGADIDNKIQNEIIENLKLSNSLPLIIVADTFNRVVFVSQGYNIGLGQQLLDVAKKL